jgi:hypothetical protein
MHTPNTTGARLLALLATALLLLASRCKKDSEPPPPQLPAATQQGLNTIGFKVNGQVWLPYYQCRAFGNPCGEVSFEYGVSPALPHYLSMQFVKQNGDKSSSLTISTFTQTTISSTSNYFDSIGITFRDENSSRFSKYPTLSGGRFQITYLDKSKRIIAGEFAFKLFDGRDTLNITEGRFDFTYNLCQCSQ